MKLKFRGILLTSILAIAGIFGVGSALVNKQIEEAPVAEKVEAASTRRFFLDCTQFSGYDNAQSIGIQYYNGSYIKIEATKLADNYWYVDVPSTNLSKVQFFRCDTGNVNNNYNWQWEGDPSSVNYYSVKEWNNSGDWSFANGADETYSVASTTPSTTTKRVWVDPKDGFYTADARAALRVFDGETYYTTYVLGGSGQYVSVGSESYIFYVDIPVNYDCQLVRLHNVYDTIWSYGKNFSDMDYDTTKIVYQWTADIEHDYSCSYESSSTIEYCKKVLDGYSTCLSSAVNGYGAYDTIKTNILDKLSDEDLNTLKASTFSASGYGTRTYGEKIIRMDNSGSLPRSSIRDFSPLALFSGSEDSLSTIIIIIASSVALLSVTALSILVIKKRKQKEE